MVGWGTLLLAGLFEIGWAVGLKLSQGFTRFWPTCFTLVSLLLSMVLLGVSIRKLPLGTAYAVWTGLGAVGTFAFSVWWFGESAGAVKLLCIGLIAAGMIGLKLTGS